MNIAMPLPKFEFDDKILDQGAEISRRLNQLRMEKFPPNAKKTLRQFSMAEVAHYLGVTQNNLKRLHLEGKGPVPAQVSSGRRSYTAEQMLELRHYLDRNGRTEVKKYVPHRKQGDKLQVIAVVNFKGGVGQDDDCGTSRPISGADRPPRACHRPRSASLAVGAAWLPAGTRPEPVALRSHPL